MALAQIGPLTGVLEAVAAAVGAGMLLGGFLAGAVGIVRGWPKRQFDRWLLLSSYGGGGFAAAFTLVDITFRYGWLSL